MHDFVDSFVDALTARYPQDEERAGELRTLTESIVELAAARASRDDLGIAVNALSELVAASALFSPWHDRPKLTVFGSARVDERDPHYAMAERLSAAMAERGWITVSGAGPGIMEAAAKGAGREHTIGVNVDLPFEQSANPYVDAESRLVEMKYFFTRKVALTKESHAFVFFPGGLGTLDEAYELLTLMHTGKTRPSPVILVDTPTGTYWDQWRLFMEGSVMSVGYLDADSDCLWEVCHSIDEAVAAIEHYYSNFVRFSLGEGRASIELRHAPSDSQLAALARVGARFAPFRVDGAAVSFAFDGRSYVALRRVIDELNAR
ncbi:MAG TPA: TIGR00730 family Rossman fold protein [Acidimicrobiales bacterium]|nr:TIGR00730 family Rossman fold protein [Acidimicrobiales bacterium]